MKIKCYAIYCSKHPLFGVDAFEIGEDVECFNPCSTFFDDFCVKPDEVEFDECYYVDGHAEAESNNGDYIIFASCDNEDYKN